MAGASEKQCIHRRHINGGKLLEIKDDDIDSLIEVCKLAEQSERYSDMCAYLEKLIKAKKGDLTDDERNLFSVGFKSLIGHLRRSWRNLGDNGDTSDDFEKHKELYFKYKDYIQAQINGTCDEVIALIDDPILKKTKSDKDVLQKKKETEELAEADKVRLKKLIEAQVFYHKMTGDYKRYKAELLQDDAKKEMGQGAAEAYKTAMSCAKDLSDTDATKLGLALNFSVCLWEIADEKQQAVDVAKAAFDNALKMLDSLNAQEYKSSTLIMQLLRDNLTLWNADQLPQEDIED